MTREKLVKLVNSVRFYEFTKFVIWTKSGSNLNLKCLLTSFAKLNISFKLYILNRVEILLGNIRYMKIYCGKCSGKMELGNIIFQRVKVSKLILSNMSNKTFVYYLWHIWSYRWNFASIKVGIETRHLKLFNHIYFRSNNSSKR